MSSGGLQYVGRDHDLCHVFKNENGVARADDGYLACLAMHPSLLDEHAEAMKQARSEFGDGIVHDRLPNGPGRVFNPARIEG